MVLPGKYLLGSHGVPLGETTVTFAYSTDGGDVASLHKECLIGVLV